MKINLRDFSYTNIKTITIAATFTTIAIYCILVRSIDHLYDLFTFFEESWPFLILHVVFAVTSIVLIVKMKKKRASLWVTLLANLIAFCCIGFYFFQFALN